MHILTVAAHTDGQTLLESAKLTAVPIQPDHNALPVTQAAVLYLLLDASPEKTLIKKIYVS